MAFKRTDFIFNFILKSDTCANGNMYRYQTNGNGKNSDFNNWCRNTIFIGLRTDNAFGDEQTNLQPVIALLKNTAFFIFMVCSIPLFAQVQPGAYQTKKYLPLLINMKVAVVGNQSSQVLTNDKRIHLVDHLRSQGVNIIKVFAPEHGFRGKEDAGAYISNEIDA